MSNIEEYARNLYLADEYIKKNPSLHEEDSPWKVGKIIHLIDKHNKEWKSGSEMNLLDVGGGAGIILAAVSRHMEENYRIKVNKYALDLSPGILEIQKKRNPQLRKALCEDISHTSLADKEVDLTLMIDVLEHVINPVEALKELRRISKFVILKVPLEDNLFDRAANFVMRGKPRKNAVEKIGHINLYTFAKLKDQLKEHLGQVLDFNFTNVFDYVLNSDYYAGRTGKKDRIRFVLAGSVYRLSPRLCSRIFGDFVMIMVKCY